MLARRRRKNEHKYRHRACIGIRYSRDAAPDIAALTRLLAVRHSLYVLI
jgi:hypothetical protein